MRGILSIFISLMCLLLSNQLIAATGLNCTKDNDLIEAELLLDPIMEVIAYQQNPYESQLEQFVLDYPSQKISELRYPQGLSEKVFLLALLSEKPELADQLQNNPELVRNFLKNNPDQIEQLFDVLGEYYNGFDLINISTQFWNNIGQSSLDEMLSRSFRATREGFVGGKWGGASILYSLGETSWVQENGYDPELLSEFNNVLLANMGISPNLLSFKNSTGDLRSDVSLITTVDLEFLTNGTVYPTAHFDGIFGLESQTQYLLNDKNAVQFRGQVMHQSTHKVDSIINEEQDNGPWFHVDSAEWVGAEASYQQINRLVDKEFYGSFGRYFHSMAEHPLVYRGELGAVLAVLDQRLSLAAEIDVLKVEESSKPRLVGEIEGTHFGGRVKLLADPKIKLKNTDLLDQVGFVGVYDFGLDPMGQNIPYKNNRFLLGIQAEK